MKNRAELKKDDTLTSFKPDRFIDLTGLSKEGLSKEGLSQDPLPSFFHRRLAALTATAANLRTRATRTAAARLLLFALIIILSIIIINLKTPIALIIPLSLLTLFLALVKLAAQIDTKIRKTNTLIDINQEEINALNGKISQFYPGSEFVNPNHNYSFDLDLFGQNSIYQMTCRAETPQGQKNLAYHLTNLTTNPETILQYQEAAKELSSQPVWRQIFQAEARNTTSKKSAKSNEIDWKSDIKRFRGATLFKFIIAANATTVTAIIALIATSTIPTQSLLYLLIPAAIVLYQTRIVNKHQQKAEHLLNTLAKYQPMLEMIEKTPFTSTYLKTLQLNLIINNQPASRVMKQLNTILWGLELRGNLIISAILNLIFLWDVWMMIRLQAWKDQYNQAFPQWTQTVASFERINSLANLAFLNPDFAWPKPADKPFQLSLLNAGHPLLNHDKRVNNSLTFNQPGQIYLITGANMSGKSTLLRMTGVNLILAMTGAPVCATEMTFTPAQIMTSIRTSDSLTDEESYFYAELKKLSRIIKSLQSGDTLFVIIDEMLRGTNSKDKHAGSAAFIHQLIRLQTNGLLATHDVELGTLANTLPNKLIPRCFEVYQTGETLAYDYLLKPGISQSLNATFLMREMGIVGEG